MNARPPCAAATPAAPSGRPDLSVVIPVYNEEKSLDRLHARLDPVLRGLGRPYEILYVDDGSRDGSLEVLKALQRSHPGTVRVVELYRNAGQFMAILAGFERVRGEVVLTLDADLQNPPEEIPRLLAKLDEGYDLVNTWRQDRHDSGFRRLASRLANRIAARITGMQLRDYGCMLRAYRREVVRQVVASREHAAYVPTLANALARRATEIPVAHSGRDAGTSKYSVLRLLQLQLDMLATFSVRPLRLLHLAGAIVAAGALLLGGGIAARALWFGGSGNEVVLALFVLLFLLVAALFVGLGLVAEYAGRIYDIVRDKPRYVVRCVHEEADDRASPGGSPALDTLRREAGRSAAASPPAPAD
ncbi:MAG: glycosyltransferase [Candidatus Polarisedimenticolia bacterium]